MSAYAEAICRNVRLGRKDGTAGGVECHKMGGLNINFVWDVLGGMHCTRGCGQCMGLCFRMPVRNTKSARLYSEYKFVRAIEHP